MEGDLRNEKISYKVREHAWGAGGRGGRAGAGADCLWRGGASGGGVEGNW